jgi:hypothetical protein
VIFAVDFDETLVSTHGRAYDDLTSPLQFLPGAKVGLRSLKKAGHMLILYSARANRAIREDPTLDPLVRAGARRVHQKTWEKDRALNQARYQQMLDFVAKELPDTFAAIDDGVQGKPTADLFIDDRALRLGGGPLAVSWDTISRIYGEPDYSGGES